MTLLTGSRCGGSSRRRFVLAVTTLPLMLLSCGFDRRRLDGGSRLAEEPLEQGWLSARPRQLETAPAMPSGVHPLDLPGGRALLSIPNGYRPNRPSPLAVMLHGAGGSAEDGLALFRPLADDAGLILLAPQSRGRTWDLLLDGYGPDVALLDQALEHVSGHYAVDAGDIAVGGFSDGASYALSLGALNGEVFRSVIAFSPGFWVQGRSRGGPAFFITHGTDDQVLPVASTSRRLVPQLEGAGYEVIYHEFEGGHVVPGDLAAEALMWFLGTG